MNYASLRTCDIANGEGVRISLFVSGCTHHCKGCFNPDQWDFNYGEPFTREVEDRILTCLEPSYIAGLSILGGEPMEPANQRALVPFLKRIESFRVKLGSNRDACQTLGDPNPTLSNPNPTLGDTNLTLGDPNPTLGDPNPTLSNPNPTLGGTNPTLGGTNPTLGGTNPTLGDPNPTLSDPKKTLSNPKKTLSNPKKTLSVPKKTLWVYTGCLLEELKDPASRWHTEVTDEFLKMIDVLVDGPFIEELKDISLRFRGSSNQRILKLR